jgi:hypothetical protein
MKLLIEVEIPIGGKYDPDLSYVFPWIEEVKDKCVEFGEITSFQLKDIPSEVDMK